MEFSYEKTVPYSFAEARKRVEEELQKEGFGVLTEIDVKETIKKKLGKDFRNYVILGACNPPFAHQALTRNVRVGLLMPCNVVVYEDDGGGTVVSAMDVEVAMGSMVPAMRDLAVEVGDKLKRAIDRV